MVSEHVIYHVHFTSSFRQLSTMIPVITFKDKNYVNPATILYSREERDNGSSGFARLLV